MSVGSKWLASGTGRQVALVSAGVAFSILACTAEDSLTTPSDGPTAASAMAAAVNYRAVDMGTLGGASSTAYGINKHGHIVGESMTGQGQNHAFRWIAGVMTDLGTLGGRSSRAFGIDDAGRIVGGATTGGPNGGTHAFLLTDRTMQDLGTLGGIFSEATAINAGGQVVGASSIGVDPLNDPVHAFLWKNGRMTDLGTLGGDYSYARGINSLGEVVGESRTASGRLHAFLWRNGTMTDLGPTRGQAFGINRSGRIVGSTGFTPRATVWVNGQKRLWGPAGVVSAGFGVNAVGLVVGVSQASGGNQAVIWNKGVSAVLRTIGGDLVHGQAFALNAENEIVGGSTTESGTVTHATLWTLK